MCYDVALKADVRTLLGFFPDLIFDFDPEHDFIPSAHIQGISLFPPHPIVYVNRSDMKIHCKMMEWSCIEYYAKQEPDMKKRNGMLNIRSERILDDPNSYWYKIRNRRCLIPITGIYEHRGIAGWKKKVPYHVRPYNTNLFLLPGLYSVAELPDKETGEIVKRFTFGLIMRDANDIMKLIHNSGDNPYRMPLFIPFSVAEEWLSEDLSEQRYKEILSMEIPSEDLEYWPVDTIRTPKLRADNKEKNEPFEWPKLPELF